MDFFNQLENLLNKSTNIYFNDMPYINIDNKKKSIFICAGLKQKVVKQETYIKHYIEFLKNDKTVSNYCFETNIFFKNNHNISMLDEVLTLDPSDEELLVLYKNSFTNQKDIGNFLGLLKHKSSFIKLMKLGNKNLKTSSNSHEKEFLETCFSHASRFGFSQEDYSEILMTYVENSRSFENRDNLLQLCFNYIDDKIILENFIEKIYGKKIVLNNTFELTYLTKVNIDRINIIQQYKMVNEKDLDTLLSFFSSNIHDNLTKLHYTTSIDYFKTKDKHCSLDRNIPYVFNLLLDTSNTEEVMNILDLYLQCFVEKNTTTEQFILFLKQNPHVFENFILHEKLNDKLIDKNIKKIINKI